MPSCGTRSPANTAYVLRLRQVTAHNSAHEAPRLRETSVVSYLTNRPELDVMTAGHQATTYRGGNRNGRTTI